jgi:hypothetical protein
MQRIADAEELAVSEEEAEELDEEDDVLGDGEGVGVLDGICPPELRPDEVVERIHRRGTIVGHAEPHVQRSRRTRNLRGKEEGDEVGVSQWGN